MCDEVKGLRVSRLRNYVWPVPFYQCPSHSIPRNIVFFYNSIFYEDLIDTV